VNESLRRRIGDAWAFRARVEREAARRFSRLASAIGTLDPTSPVVAMMAGAAEDEIRHAALCAELSARYGVPAGADDPGDEIAPRHLGRREAILYEVVAACCITETESVATVTSLLAEPSEPRVREVLHEIARDEVSHSRMGWAHLARQPPGGAAFLAIWIPIMLDGTVEPGLFGTADDDPEDEELLRHGILPSARKREVFVGTLEAVVLPGLERFGVDPAPGRAWLAAMSRATSVTPR
jgi:hypothetical protein